MLWWLLCVQQGWRQQAAGKTEISRGPALLCLLPSPPTVIQRPDTLPSLHLQENSLLSDRRAAGRVARAPGSAGLR